MKVELDLRWETLLRWLLGLVLVWAALSKLANIQDFYASLLAYRLPMPAAGLRLVALALPWLEFLCGLQLLSSWALRPALWWALVLFVAFTLATGQAWARGLDISCGCLDLRLLGLNDGSKPGFLQSVGFAFFRALALTAAAWLVLRRLARAAHADH